MSESSMRAAQVEQRMTSCPLPNQRTHPWHTSWPADSLTSYSVAGKFASV